MTNPESVGIGTGLWCPTQLDPEAHFAAARAAGFDAVELNVFRGPGHLDTGDERALTKVEQGLRNTGMAVWSIHSRDLASLAADDPADRERQLDHIRDCLDLADRFAATTVVSHGLLIGPFPADPQLTDRRLHDALEALLPAARASRARVAFENGQSRAPGVGGCDVLARLRDFPADAYGFVLDPGHANIAGDIEPLLSVLDRRLISLHLNDNAGDRDDHLVPGEGTVNWEALLAMLTRVGYGGCVMYEVEAVARGRDPAAALTATMAAHRRLFGGPQSTPN